MLKINKDSFAYEMIETVVVSFVVIFFISNLIGTIELVWGASMEPNFHTGERVLVEKITKPFKDYKRGEIIVLKSSDRDNKHYIKRVIGVPGDIVKIYDCSVIVTNDEGKFMLKEEYLSPSTCTLGGSAIKDGRSIRLEENTYIALGDNRMNSIDSRSFGLVEKRNVVGRVVFIFWPVSKFGIVE